jgi:hypothetical protein
MLYIATLSKCLWNTPLVMTIIKWTLETSVMKLWNSFNYSRTREGNGNHLWRRWRIFRFPNSSKPFNQPISFSLNTYFLRVVYFTALLVSRLGIVEWHDKGRIGKSLVKLSWPERGNIPTFVWRDWEKASKELKRGYPVSRPSFEPSTCQIQAMSIKPTPAPSVIM